MNAAVKERLTPAMLAWSNCSRPHQIKEHLLQTAIFPKYGLDGYFGLESNPLTRGMYARYGIESVRVTDQEMLWLPA